MRLRTRLRLAILLWFVGGFSLIVLCVHLSRWYSVILLLLFLGIAFYTMSLKCPNCNKPVLNNPVRVFGIEMWLTTAWMPKKCSKCSYDLE